MQTPAVEIRIRVRYRDTWLVVESVGGVFTTGDAQVHELRGFDRLEFWPLTSSSPVPLAALDTIPDMRRTYIAADASGHTASVSCLVRCLLTYEGALRFKTTLDARSAGTGIVIGEMRCSRASDDDPRGGDLIDWNGRPATIRTRDRDGDAVSIAEYLFEHCTWDRTIAARLAASSDSGVTSLIFERRIDPVRTDQALAGLPLRADDLRRFASMRELTCRQRPAGRPPEATRLVTWIVEITPIHYCYVRERWNELVALPYLRALRTVQQAQALSLIPVWDRWAPRPANASWIVKVDVQDRKTDAGPLRRDDFENDGDGGLHVRFGSLAPEPGATFLATGSLEGFRSDAGLPLPIECELIALPAISGTERRGIMFGASALRASGGRRVRLGALDLDIGGALPDRSNGPLPHQFQVQVETEAGWRGSRFSTPPVDLASVRIEMQLPIAAVKPGGTDSLPEELFVPSEARGERPDADAAVERLFRREPPLVLPLDATTPATELASWVLDATEGTGAENDGRGVFPASHTVRLALRTNPAVLAGSGAAGSAPDRVVVIDRQPFVVAEVAYAPFARQAAAAGVNEIANWTNADPEGAKWQVATFDEPFALVLPPQAVGEAMEKSHTLRPDEPVDYRFSPPARQTLFPSYFRQAYAEAPWNIRRVLGYPGQRAPGAELRSLQYELLYGLSCSVERPFLRLAETMSLLGWIPGRMRGALQWPARGLPGDASLGDRARDEFTYQERRLSWAMIYNQYLSRLAVYEPWDTHRSEHDPTARTPLELTEGVSCELRSGADLYYPASLPPNAPADVITPKEDGLKGGATFPFEVPQFYTRTVTQPHAVSSELKRPAFSALGGWGFTKASFDGGNTSIYADVAMGRAFSITLERLGRIGVFWNLAKHVIVYERAVLPTRQFVDRQERFEGQPILRKVREYVEIIEPRAEFGSADRGVPAHGFVNAIDFTEQRQINVNSEWGSVVGSEGWRIPLWQPNADAEVYPKPAIRLEFAGDEAGRAIPIPQGLDEPEKLFFYSAFRSDAPPSWLPVPTVDFSDFPLPAPAANEFAGGSVEQTTPDDPQQPPGFHAFTLRVVPSDWPANVVSGRVERALSAVVHNVTMMRGRGESAVAAPSNLPGQAVTLQPRALAAQVYPAVRDLISRSLQEIAGAPNAAAADICRRVHDEVAQVRRKVQDAAKVLEPAALQQLKTRIVHDVEEKALNTYWQRLSEVASDAHKEFRAAAERKTRELAAGGELTAEALTAAAVLEIRGLTARLALARANAETLRSFIERAVIAVETCRREYQSASDEAKSKLDALSDRALRHERFDQLDRDLRRALQRIRTAVQDATRDWLPAAAGMFADPVIKEYDDAVKSARDKVDTSADEAVAALTGYLDRLPRLDSVAAAYGASPVAAAIARAIATLEARMADLDAVVTAISGEDLTAAEAGRRVGNAIDAAWTTAFDPLLSDKTRQDVLKEVLTSAGRALDAFDPLLRRVQSVPATLDAYLDGLGSCQDIAALRGLLDQGRTDPILHAAGDFVERVVSALPVDTSALAEQAGSALTMLRAFGKPPNVPDLDFARRSLAYYFDERLPAIDITPTIARVKAGVDEAARALSSLGTKLPTVKLLDRCLPARLEQFDLSKVLPNFAGLELPGLFKNLKMPAAANEHVHVTHGADPQTRRAWVQADVDFQLERPQEVFAIGPVKLDLTEGRFTARTRVEGELGGTTKRITNGSISGRWTLQIGDIPLVAFVRTTLAFDDSGSLTFDVAPERVEMSAVMKFLNDFLAKLAGKGGFTLGMLPDGFQSSLELPAPNMQAGMFGIANFRLSVLFGLRLKDPSFKAFAFSIGFGIGTKERPFTLSVFVLGGAGYATAVLKYAPSSQSPPICIVDIGVYASATFALSLPAITGGVYVYFGITVHYETSGVDAGLSLGILFQINGEVCVLGFIQVWVSICLEARYEGGTLVGRGRLTVSIKIGFFEVSFSVGVEFKLGGGAGQGSALPRPDAVLALNEATAPPIFAQPQRQAQRVSVPRRPVNAAAFDEAAREYLEMLV
jgi:hypothetical protein